MHLAPRFEGRLGRRGFLFRILALWGCALAGTLALAVVATIIVRAASVPPVEAARVMERSSLLLWLGIAPWMAGVTVQRLHDLGWPGWLAVLPVASAFVSAAENWIEAGGERVNLSLMLPGPAGAAVLALQLGTMVLMLAGIVLPGRGANRHGPRAECPPSARSALPLPDRAMFGADAPSDDRGA